MSGGRLKSGVGNTPFWPGSHMGTAVFADANCALEGFAGNAARYVGGLSSLASQPCMSDVIGSFDTTIL